MRISVIIPAVNEEAVIERAVRSAVQGGASEVLVVDGGSRDRTGAAAQAAGAQVLCSPPGRARQQNAGAAQAAGDWLLFLHADNWLSPQALEQLQAAAASNATEACAYRQAIAAPGLLYRLLEWGNARRAAWRRLPYGDQGLALKRSLFTQLNGFPDVPLMEDVLLMRAVRRRTRLRLLPGPLHVDARRWQRHGVIRQTARNWLLLTLFQLGVSPQRLARWYRRHDHASLGGSNS